VFRGGSERPSGPLPPASYVTQDQSRLISAISHCAHTVNGYGRYTYVTASIHEKTRDRETSLADCACLALALSRGLPAVTEERTWEACDVGVPVIRIR
jgi:PIN domain nuclease of toxin-antitoxin system